MPIPQLTIRRAALASILVLLCLSCAPAAEPSPTDPLDAGTITGRVRNAITGHFLPNARVQVRGSAALALADEAGFFRLTGLPSGTVELEVLYTGLDPRRVLVELPSGGSARQDVELTSAALAGREAVVQLDPFIVASAREADGAARAINEQRFAPNLKTVAAIDREGDASNNLGDFLKFVPGVQMQGGTSTSEPETVFVRGFPPNLTVVTADGAPVASTDSNGDQRQVMLSGVSINHYSRVEVTKVPTPATAADTMAGSVNLVTRRAFERSSAEFRYQVGLVGNSRELALGRAPFPDETRRRPLTPSVTLDYTLPLAQRLGLVLSAARSDYYINGDWVTKNWATSGAGTGASIARPYLLSHELRENKRRVTKESLGLRIDWKLTPRSTLSVAANLTETQQFQRATALTFSTGVNRTPTLPGGVTFAYGPDFVVGATGQGSVTYGGGGGAFDTATSSHNRLLRYAFDDGVWRIEAAASLADSRIEVRTVGHGLVGLVNATTRFPVRVEFADIGPDGPARTRVFNNAHQEIDPYDPRHFALSAVSSRELTNRDGRRNLGLDVRRRLASLPFPVSWQLGGAEGVQTRDKGTTNPAFTYQGDSGEGSLAPFLATVYRDRRLRHNNVDRAFPMLSAERVFQSWERTPSLLVMTPAQQVSAEIARIAARESIAERVSAFYVQAEARLFGGRLNVLTGIRRERTVDEGRGRLQDAAAVWARNPDGTFARNAAGARIRRPEAGAVGSLAEVALVHRELGYWGRRSYAGNYPSLHLTGSLRDNLLVRVAYARTYGRPNFRDIIPNAVVNEFDVDALSNPDAVRGTITVRNTGLRPWTADNLDFSLEYYSPHGGLLAAGCFRKEISNFFGTLAKVATAADLDQLGLEREYLGWQVNSTINAGDARVTGWELSVNHPLHPLGAWGRPFSVFANCTKLVTQGSQSANFTGFLPLSVNAGVTFARQPIILTAKWNHRGDQTTGPYAAYGPTAIRYYPARTHLDLNFDYRLRPNLGVVAYARNLLNVRSGYFQRGPEAPPYAIGYQTVEYGVALGLGLKGSF